MRFLFGLLSRLFTVHSTTTGDIIGLKTMSMHMIVLHKVKDAEMLLEKRSSIYSDRPVLPVVKLYENAIPVK